MLNSWSYFFFNHLLIQQKFHAPTVWARRFAGYQIRPGTGSWGAHSQVEIQGRKQEVKFSVVSAGKEEAVGPSEQRGAEIVT